MKNALVFVGIGGLVILIGMWMINRDFTKEADTIDMINVKESMTDTLTLSSGVFENGESIPARFTCDGESMSPPLAWSSVPEGTKSLALIMDDPDVPKQLKTDGVFDHWTLFNIPPETKEITTGGTAGVRGANGAGKNQYAGPCPPKEYEPSEHRYFFRLYALDPELPLKEGATKSEVLAAMQGHILSQAELVGKYKRP